MRQSRLFAVVVLMLLVLAACGQKPGVHQKGFAAAPGDGAQGGNDGGTDGTGGNDGVGGTPGPDGNPTSGPTTGPSGDPNNPGPGAPITGPVVRTGIDDARGIIKIGIHAPTSGAAPIKPEAFATGKDLYWNWLKAKGIKVLGKYDVQVAFRDDKYDPATAVTKCNELGSSEKVFLLIGGAGSDQINQCSNYANQRGIPYFSPGVQEAKVKSRKWYWALSPTYAQQMPMLAQYIKKLGAAENRYGPGGTETDPRKDNIITIGFVRPDTGSFDDSEAALKTAIAGLGSGYKLIIKTVQKEGNQQEASTVATDFKNLGVDIISPITAPSFTLYLSNNTGKQGYKPRYVGVGVTNAVNQGIRLECSNGEFEGAMFFSPWPGWSNVMAGQYDKDFRDSIQYTPGAAKLNGKESGGDILLAVWGIMKDIHRILEKSGPTLSRQSVQRAMQTMDANTGGFFPVLKFTPGDPFGGRGMHALLGKCEGTSSGQFIEHTTYPGLREKF